MDMAELFMAFEELAGQRLDRTPPTASGSSATSPASGRCEQPRPDARR